IFLSYCVIDPLSPGFSPLPLHGALPVSTTRAREAAASMTPANSGPTFPVASSTRPGMRKFAPNTPEVIFRISSSDATGKVDPERPEEHTSEPQSRGHLVCRLLLEKKKHQ